MVREQSRRRFLQLAAAGATSVGISSVASRKSRAVPAIDGPSVIGQTGTIVASRRAPGRWQRVSFETPFALTPVVIVQPVGARGPVPVSIRKVTRRGFEFTFTRQNRHGEREPARVSYLAVARGVHDLSGSLINAEAGFVAADTSRQTVSFDHSFTERPIVFAHSQTHSSQATTTALGGPVTPRINVTDPDRFSVRLQAQEHQHQVQSETIGYLAFEPGSGVLDPPMGALDQLLGRFEISTAPKSVTDPWHQLVFEHAYDQPILLAGIQTEHDAVRTRVANLDSKNAAIRLEHNSHAADSPERIGYAVFENEHLIYV
ncbi:twin-arginine translocation signal domain-containing protein [Halocatena pleomorpha]|uniref:Twin-arginine translocation signal domain-containing protein n=1 Tax=Halocatena pleomorpha TaxID=1785090 RepID=A0A3P3RKP6_9EURY|nr:twin-arginine translocation signal domain-containing protein [Halocatena pleomorpha]RRJ33430.1 twin-arginine translocation signal domain-containing protein [Halocatena pleomorpha]